MKADALQYGDKKNNPAFNEDPSRNIGAINNDSTVTPDPSLLPQTNQNTVESLFLASAPTQTDSPSTRQDYFFQS